MKIIGNAKVSTSLNLKERNDVFMKMNYNDWFFKSHRYLQAPDDHGILRYTDTKWVPVNDRYRKLIELESELFTEQPFGIMGNKRGFDKLLELLEESNYSFDDINDSLIETYKNSLTNAMSRMLVNTRTVMFKTNTNDRKNVSMDKFTHYYIVDAPFNQMHFGDRDEFIRQQLDKMHTTENGQFIPLTDFIQGPYTELLGFTILCTVNGYICNDCLIALDDKGFKFKIGWPYSSDCDFIIYKFDESIVHHVTVDTEDVTSMQIIPIDKLGISKGTTNCLVNIYDKNFIRSAPSIPNFGTLSPNGLKIHNIQQKTLDNIERQKSEKLELVIYSLKYFHEVPNVYPAVNYYDMIDTRKVFAETEEKVKDKDGKQILSSSTMNVNELEICTPPIVLDRPINLSFKVLKSCLSLGPNLLKWNNVMTKTGIRLTGSTITELELTRDILPSLQQAYASISDIYTSYIQGAMLTSLVTSEKINRFERFLTNLKNLAYNTDPSLLQKYGDANILPELYGDGYLRFVKDIIKPFQSEVLESFADINKVSVNYFIEDNSSRFNRPVSEQCFITLKYSRQEECWLFDLPEIKHFKGIGNSFYIDSNLEGKEIFKFFVLYTDTDSPAETNVNALNLENVFDFDMFCDEVRRHMGYIRYWDAENKLMKLSQLVFNEYSGDKCVQVLSKILKRKLDGADILDIYPSDMNYEPSNITSDNWKEYDEISERSPFAINFLFYTISMMYDNEDKMQAFFLRSLTDRLYNKRYADIDISSIIDKTDVFPINYSQYSIAPIGVDQTASSVPITPGNYAYYCIPYTVSQEYIQKIGVPYRYTFNVYEDGAQYPMLIENGFNKESYIGYSSVETSEGSVQCFKHDIQLARMLTFYLTYSYDCISSIQTNYQTAYDIRPIIESSLEILNPLREKIVSYYNDHTEEFQHSSSGNVVGLTVANKFILALDTLTQMISEINKCELSGKMTTLLDVVNELLKVLHNVYVNNGFDDGVSKRTRNLYLHLKKINTTLSPYQFKKWIEELDTDMIARLDSTRSLNENTVYGHGVFEKFSQALSAYKRIEVTNVDKLISSVDSLREVLADHFDPIVEFCDDIIKNYIFELYALDTIEFNKDATYSTKPTLVSVDFTSDDHFHPKVGNVIESNPTLIFQPIVEQVNGSWKIIAISKICEYTFFSDTEITNKQLTVLDHLGTSIGTVNGTFRFVRVGSTADDMASFDQIPNMKNTPIEFENIHETFEVNNKGMIVNKKFADMNYELLIGNRFTQLDHTSELVLQPKTWIQGSVDRLYIPNQQINRLTNREYGQHVSRQVFFKPSQVIHIPIDENGCITPVGGKYFVGQTLYMMTDDNRYVFPIIITAVDYSESNGFVEAVVDSINAKWFNLEDPDAITRYLKEDIKCTVTDDNIRNFLDEYTDSSYVVYHVPECNDNIDPSDEDNVNAYSMPGDPLYVTSNAHYVYTRLNYFFHELVPNRFIDDSPQTHHMMYIGESFINNEDDHIQIKMINHSFEPFTDPENYPILREEPDDHFIWRDERNKFNEVLGGLQGEYNSLENQLARLNAGWSQVPNKTKKGWENYNLSVENIKMKMKRNADFSERVRSWLNQLEYPTTWYNVRSYEAAMVYIQNGRATIDPTHISNIRNIPYTDKLNVFLYDWEHKYWISPDKYSVEFNKIDSVKVGEFADYKTYKVLHSITIKPNDGFEFSKHVLIYFSYDKSDVFDSIEMNEYSCDVKFKPILSLANPVEDYDPYSRINIRKHLNGEETYTFNGPSEIKQFSKQGYLITRPKRSGKYEYTPAIRYCDMSVISGDNEYSFSDFDLYVRIPFLDVTTSQKYIVPGYSVSIIRPIDGFVPYQTIKLICISNNSRSSYDGNISSVMFEAYTQLTSNNSPELVITNSTLPRYMTGNYICTVLQDANYSHSGGVISINIIPNEEDVVDGNWIRIPESLATYKILPKEFVIVPKQDMDISGETEVSFKTTYLKETDEEMSETNDKLFNPFEYYFDTKEDIRYPLSDVRRNQHKERLVIDKELNPNVKTIKSTYIGICRYSAQKIPKNGIIDMTGYLPTPLSRDRYEFWVNGRCIINQEDVKIISPTSIQLCNLKSLRNFECVELVDDISDSPIVRQGPVYVDLNGKPYASYRLALLSNSSIAQQDIRYTFNANNQKPMQLHTEDIIPNPNNHDVENDILGALKFLEGTKSYNKLYNLPSINGVDIFHPKSYHLGLVETPNEEILKVFDKVWRKEAVSNPLFPMSHFDRLGLIDGRKLTLHSRYSGKENSYIFYATGVTDQFFTLYIANRSNGRIDDVTNTLKIIPFIRTGVTVSVDTSFHGKWLCSTHPNTKPVKII